MAITGPLGPEPKAETGSCTSELPASFRVASSPSTFWIEPTKPPLVSRTIAPTVTRLSDLARLCSTAEFTWVWVIAMMTPSSSEGTEALGRRTYCLSFFHRTPSPQQLVELRPPTNRQRGR